MFVFVKKLTFQCPSSCVHTLAHIHHSRGRYQKVNNTVQRKISKTRISAYGPLKRVRNVSFVQKTDMDITERFHRNKVIFFICESKNIQIKDYVTCNF